MVPSSSPGCTEKHRAYPDIQERAWLFSLSHTSLPGHFCEQLYYGLSVRRKCPHESPPLAERTDDGLRGRESIFFKDVRILLPDVYGEHKLELMG